MSSTAAAADSAPVTYGMVARRGGGWLPLISLTGLVGTLCTLALPAVLGRAIDAIVTGGGSQRWLAVAAGLIVLAVIADVAEVPAETACVASTTAWLRNHLVRHVLAIGPHGARRFGAGDLVSRVSGNAVDAAQAGPAAVTVATAGLVPLGSLALLAWIDPWLAVTFLAGVVLVALVLRTFTRRTAEVIGAYQRIQGDIAARLTESLAGARTIAAAGTAGREERRVLSALPDLNAQGVRTWRVLARSSAQAAVVGPLVLVGVLAAGGLLLGHGRISMGEFLAASRYAVLQHGLGSLTGVTGRMARARAGVRRAAEVLGVDPVGYGDHALPAGPGHLELRAVTVRDGGNVLLDNADLDLPGGTLVAVVGRSGAGKSTLAAVAARLRDPDSGEVLLDGVPLPGLAHDALHAAVGCAFERPVLIGGTVADAVGLGRERELVHAATRATSAHEFVRRLPQGYDTPLADAPMSGGEAQRLGLARGWHASRLLVLDDATSALDMVTEMQIAQALAARDCTRLVVTHRASTAARADLVVWLDGGRVRAVGPHARLWSDPAYREVFA